MRDHASGDLAAWAVWVVATMRTYCEISPSKTGLKMFCWGTLPKGKRNASEERGVEMYDSGRYFTVTGLHLPDSPLEISSRNSDLHHLYKTLLGEIEVQEAADPKKTALEILGFFGAKRTIGYGDWLAVGQALHSVSDDLLGAWDDWSKSSDKYQPGICEKKWRSFRRGGGLTLGSLVYWAQQDGWTRKRTSVILAKPSNGKPAVTETAKIAAAADGAPVTPLAWLKSFGVDVVRVVKIGGKRGVFDLLLRDNQTVQLGTVSDVLIPKTVQSTIADATRIVIPELKRVDWRPIGAELIRIAEHQNVGADPQSELAEWVEGFICQSTKICKDEIEVFDMILSFGVAKLIDGTVFLQLVKFMAAILAISPAKPNRADLIQRLYRDGFSCRQLSRRISKCEEKKSEVVKKLRAWVSLPGYAFFDNSEVNLFNERIYNVPTVPSLSPLVD